MKPRLTGLFATLLTIGTAGLVSAATYEFGLRSTLRANDNFTSIPNPSGTTTLWDNTLSFGIEDSTPLSVLKFNADGVLRYINAPSGATEFRLDDPDLSFSFDRDGARSNLSISASLVRDRLNFIDPSRLVNAEVADDGTGLLIDTGLRETRSLGFSALAEVSDLVGFQIDLSHTGITYNDTADARLFDNQTNGAGLTGFLRWAEFADARIGFSTQGYTADDADRTERRTDKIFAGMRFLINPVLLLDTEINQTRIETQQLALGTATTTSTAIAGSVELIREFKNGEARLSFNSALDAAGQRDTLQISRKLETRLSELDASIGATRGPMDETNLIGAFSITTEFPTGSVQASLSRSYATSNASTSFGTTRASVGLMQSLSRQARLNFSLGYARNDADGTGAVVAAESWQASPSLSYDLTEDWDLTAGLTHRAAFTDNAPSIRSNEVFISFGRSFAFKP